MNEFFSLEKIYLFRVKFFLLPDSKKKNLLDFCIDPSMKIVGLNRLSKGKSNN